LVKGDLWAGPKYGSKDDKAHPPIHPVKYASSVSLSGGEWKIYDLLTRHFLASVCKDATGTEMNVQIEIGGENFYVEGE
jgi:DNA topoisomerase-3